MSNVFEERPHCYALSINHLLSYCHGCLKSGIDLRKCSGCKFFVYCSADCQKKDWRLHKNECLSCKRHNGVSNEEIRLVMRLAVKWAAGDMGEIVVNGDTRSLSTLQQHSEALEDKACQFLEDFKVFFEKRIVGDDVIKRMCKVTCVNSFSLTNEHSTTIGIALCIRLSAINHSCKPNLRYAYRQDVAVMVPTNLSRMPRTLEEARHSYINDLLPRETRREILKRDYNFDCECDGCLDDERNDQMEGWHCEECEDGWLPPREDTRCTRCGWAITIDHFELCRMAEETAKSSNKVLLSSQYKLEARVQLAHKIAPILKGALYKFNVLRVPSLRTLYENAIGEKNTDDMLKYGSQLLSLQEQYQNKDDLALCHLRYGLAQAYKSAGKDDLCRELIRGAREVFGRAYGTNSKIYSFISLMS